MGIIMERLNTNIQQLQDSVVSAYENVSAGIVENAKSSGIAGLDNTFEIFSDSSFIAADANLRSTVSEPAAYPGPVESLTKDSPILQTLQEQGFRPERELDSLFKPGWDKIGPWADLLVKKILSDKLNSDRTIDGELADEAARKQAKGPVSEVVPDPPSAKTLQSVLTVPKPPNEKVMGDVYGQDQNMYLNPSAINPRSPVSKFVPDPPTALAPMFPHNKTYFQTIDQNAEQIQTNPQPETALILQQQFSAVQEMTSAVNESLNLYQQLNFNSVLKVR